MLVSGVTRTWNSLLVRTPRLQPRVARITLKVAFGFLLLFVALELNVWLTNPYGLWYTASTGDYVHYLDAVRRWMAGGSFYQPYQLAGPYVIRLMDFPVLYPPIALPLLVLSSYLPPVLWWVIPIVISSAVVWHWRPPLLGWTLILACIAVPHTLDIYGNGNPGIWVAAFLALGTIRGWPAVLVALKPSLAPFMLIGVNHRSWWFAAILLVLVSLVFLPLWVDYVTSLLNARGPDATLLYSFRDIPSMLIPLIAWRLSGKRPAGLQSRLSSP